MTSLVRRTPILVLAGLTALTVAGCGSSSSGGASASGTPSAPPSAAPSSTPSLLTSPPVATSPPTSTASAIPLTLSTTKTGPCPAPLSGHPLPAGVPSPKGAVVYNFGRLGATRVWFLKIPGGSTQLATLRDAYDKVLVAKGYTITHTDMEHDHEAESEFTGPHAGTSNFRGLCDGHDSFRLKLTK